MSKKNILLIFGFGYTAKFMCQKFSKKNWEVFCTTRFKEKAKEIKSLNATPFFFDDEKKNESKLSRPMNFLPNPLNLQVLFESILFLDAHSEFGLLFYCVNPLVRQPILESAQQMS